jgi:hypothetical protein
MTYRCEMKECPNLQSSDNHVSFLLIQKCTTVKSYCSTFCPSLPRFTRIYFFLGSILEIIFGNIKKGMLYT